MSRRIIFAETRKEDKQKGGNGKDVKAHLFVMKSDQNKFNCSLRSK